MFEPGFLAREASKCKLLLANPPYEKFTPEQRDHYAAAGEPVTAQTKVVEMLSRTLPHLRPGTVFGVVVPQGVLDDDESSFVRDFLRRECELTEIDVFSDKLFEAGEHETAVLMGRRRLAGRLSPSVTYRRVRDRGMAAFKERLAFSSEREVPRATLTKYAERGLLLPDLPEVWDYLADLPPLGEQVFVQQGRQYWTAKSLKAQGLFSKTQQAGWIPVFLTVKTKPPYSIVDLPTQGWVPPSGDTFRARGGGPEPGTSQVVLNYARVSREEWRLKAVVDERGHGVSSRFLIFRPRPAGPSLRVLWAILNGPLANAYSYCYAGKKEAALPKDWRRFPLPRISEERHAAIHAACLRYLSVVEAADAFMQPTDERPILEALLAMDAAVLRLYDLPPRLERQLLEIFQGVERPGVGCPFTGYYPEGLKAYVPLNELISEDYKRSQLGRFRANHKPSDSPEIVRALRRAAEDFRDE
jgi:hypothetical protein